jgi:ATP-binding cassette subfamily F protein 3
MRHALTEALQNFEGAIIVVSHDRHLLKNTVDTFWLVAEGKVEEFKGDLHDYETWLQNYEPVSRSESSVDDKQVELSGGLQNESSEDRKERKRFAAEKRKKLSPLKKQLSQAESVMSKAQEQLVILEDKLADSNLYLHENKDKLKILLDEQTKQKQILEDAELQWFELSEEIEDAEQAED